MAKNAFVSPREAARPFTPELTGYVNDPLFSKIWEDTALSKRDRSLVTVAALIALHSFDELPAHLNHAIANGLSKKELSALITHMAFYAGFPAAISASATATEALGPRDEDAQ